MTANRSTPATVQLLVNASRHVQNVFCSLFVVHLDRSFGSAGADDGGAPGAWYPQCCVPRPGEHTVRAAARWVRPCMHLASGPVMPVLHWDVVHSAMAMQH